MSMFVAALLASAAAEAADLQPEEIVVTGERVARSTQETAASVSVTTAADLERQAAPDRIEQVLALVPNIQLGSAGEGPAIRGEDSTGVLQGADAFLGGSRPRATLQVDGRALGFNEFIYGLSSVWDVARVEVYRGPQTTTQGRNAIAGAIFVETNDPTWDYEGRVRGVIGNYDTRQGSAVVSGPIVADQIAARVAVDVRNHRSWVDYSTVAVVGADPREDDYALARAKLRIEPKALPDLKLGLTYVHLDSKGPQGESADRPYKRRRNIDGDNGYWNTNVDSLVGELDYALSPNAGLSLTAAYGDARIDRFGSPGGGRAVVHANDLSLEAIATYGKAGDALQALAGVYRLTTESEETIDLSAFIGFGDFTDDQKSLGLFGEATFALTPRLFLTGGARYQRDTQDRFGALAGFTVDYDRSFDAFLPKLALAYDLSDDVRVGAIAARGFNPGGTTISFETGFQDTFEQETLWNYELYARTSLMGGRLRLNANLFYTDYKDAQRPQTRVGVRPDGSEVLETDIDNAPKARSYGVEVEAAWAPSRRFALRAGLGLLDTKIQRTLDPVDPILGKEFSRAPHLSAALGASWSPLAALTLDAQARHNADYFSDDANTRAFRIQGVTVADAKASYAFGRFTAFAFVRNAFDELYLTSSFGDFPAPLGDPREYGVGLEARF